MTTAKSLNPWERLSQLAQSKVSGCLEFDGGLVSWKIYLQQGNVNYVYCSAQLLDRLKCHLHYLGCKQAVAAFKKLPSSYVEIQFSLQEGSSRDDLYSKVISWLLAEKHLEPSQALELIKHITQDALQFYLWLDKGTSSWHEIEPVPAWIKEELGQPSSLRVSEYLKVAETRLKQWQNCSAQLLSVHQRLYFTYGWEQKPLPTSGSLDRKALKELTQVIRGRTSILQLSLLLQKDELHVAQILSPYLDEKIICLRPAQAPLDRLPSIPRPEKKVEKTRDLPPEQLPLDRSPTMTRPEKKVRQSSSVISTERKKTAVTATKSAVKTWKIVCIDDSPTILKEIKRFLNDTRFEITAIDDPVKAVSEIFRIKPDLILLDITMPKINGYKICGLLRSSGNCDGTPIIMVTGNTGLVDKARAKIAGATDYFTKPFTQQGLRQIIEKYLE